MVSRRTHIFVNVSLFLQLRPPEVSGNHGRALLRGRNPCSTFLGIG
jgi:hypothetical protein